jgi:ketosteroid isomerase-like protein
MSAKEAFEIYKTELNKHDFERLVPLISEECVFWHPTGVYKGLDQVRQGLEKGWTVETDEMALCNYTFFYSGNVGDQKIHEEVHGTNCFRLEHGHWKVLREHLSFTPA